MKPMNTAIKQKSLLIASFEFMELVYHSVVREVRTQSGNATFGILKEVGQIATFMAVFYLLFMFMGRSAAIRGDFMMFLITGILLLMTHIKAISSVRSANNATSPMMMHAPMTVILSILANAFAGLYLQAIAVFIVVTTLWIFGMDTSIQNPPGLVLPVIFSWASGIGIGMIFMMIAPVAPGFMKVFTQAYMRAQMLTSGKFLPAAYMPSSMIGFFDWNPLFHTIDQARLATFINYNKEVSSLDYAIWFTFVTVTIGLMGELWARKNLSASKHGDNS